MKTTIIKLAWLTGAALTWNLGGCGGDASSTELADEEDFDVDGKAEAWNRANNPAYVDRSFKYRIADLPVRGEAREAPWAGDYWATQNDSINVRWDGGDSPAEKVAKAFDLPGFPEWVTNNVGIYGNGSQACDDDSDCTGDDGSSCVRPRGVTGERTGRCIPGWWGICHGWAPAAIAEPAPKKPVTKNGVTFYPGDITALASFAYQDGLPVKFLSERCDAEGRTLHTDNNGRVTEGECRDMNAGSLYVVLANMLGLRGTGIVEDRTWDLQVWNQPVRGFEVTNAEDGKLKEITKAEAIALVGGTGTTYAWNTRARRFFHVELSVQWITEAPPSRSSVDPDRYTRTDRYAFVLESDSRGNVIGGEWIDGSKKNHPDFVWWPTGKPRAVQGGLSYEMVKELIDASAAE